MSELSQVLGAVNALTTQVNGLSGLLARVDERSTLTLKAHSEKFRKLEIAIQTGDSALLTGDHDLATRVKLIEETNATRALAEAEWRGKLKGLVLALGGMQMVVIGVFKIGEWVAVKFFGG